MTVRGPNGVTTHTGKPVSAEHVPTGLFANRTVSKLPSRKTRRFLDLVGHKNFPFRRLFERGIGRVSSKSYGYLLSKQNPLNKLSASDLRDTINAYSRIKGNVDQFIKKKLAHLRLELRPDNFHCYMGSYLCSYEAIKAALEMLDADAAGKSALTVPFSDSVSKLPKVARDAIETDLKEHYALPAETVTELMKKELKMADLVAVAGLCQSKTDDEVWAKAQGVPLKHMPGHLKIRIKDLIEEKFIQEGLKGFKEHAQNYVQSGDLVVSKDEVTKYARVRVEDANIKQDAIHKAIDENDLSGLGRVTPRDLSQEQKSHIVQMLSARFVQSGMNSGEAGRLIIKTLNRNYNASISAIKTEIDRAYAAQWRDQASDESRLYKLSTLPLAERCVSDSGNPNSLSDDHTGDDLPKIPPETVKAIQKDGAYWSGKPSVSDLEVSLEIIARRLMRESPFVAIAACPSQCWAQLPAASKEALRDFVQEEIAGNLKDNAQVQEIYSAMNKSVFVKELEDALRDIIPGRLFRPEALDILGLPSGASEEDIKKAYRKLSLENHPDKFPESSKDVSAAQEEKFKAINNAHARLTQTGGRDPGRRPILPA